MRKLENLKTVRPFEASELQLPLPLPPPINFAYLPEHLCEDIAEFLLLLRMTTERGLVAPARPALPRSWVVFKSPSRTRTRHSAC